MQLTYRLLGHTNGVGTECIFRLTILGGNGFYSTVSL
jgi:hypothetical protein